MEGHKNSQKEGEEGQQASEGMFTRRLGKARRYCRRRQSSFPAREVDHNSSKKRSRDNDKLLPCLDIPGENKLYKRPRTLTCTDLVIPADKTNSIAIKMRRSLSLRSAEEEYTKNNRSRNRRPLSRANEKIKTRLDGNHGWLRLLINRLKDRVPSCACAHAEEADTAGAAEQFPSINISEEHVNDNCVVCQESFEIGEEGCEMPCSHMFHKKCILEWISSNPTCPVCRFKIRSPRSSSSAYNNSQSAVSPYLPRSNRFSAYQSYSKEFSDSPSRRSPT